MAKTPSYIDKVNAVVTFIENPCDAPWTVYWESAVKSAIKQILVLLLFGFDDVVRGYFRPRGVYSARKTPFGRRGKRRKPRRIGIPELGETIGKRLPGAEKARGRTVTQGVKNLWVVDGVIQRALWYWLVVDVTVDFFYTWATLVQESEFCRYQDNGSALREGVSDPVIGLLGYQQVLVTENRYTHGAVATAIGSFEISAGTWDIFIGANYVNKGDTVQQVELLLTRTPASNDAFASSGRQSVEAYGSVGLIANASVRSTDVIYSTAFLDNGSGEMTGIIFWANQQPSAPTP